MRKKMLLLLFSLAVSMGCVAQIYSRMDYSYDENGNVIERRGTYAQYFMKGFAIDSLQAGGAAIKIYPSPTSDFINISGANPQGREAVTYNLYGDGGQLVATKQTSENVVRFDLTTVPAGIYLLHIEGDEGLTYKIVKK